MTVLSNVDIENYMRTSSITIIPFKEENVEASSYDLTVGRVLAATAEKGDHAPCYLIEPGGAAAVLTAEKIALKNDIAGYVNLMNRKAVEGMELVNPGHIDPGWGTNSKGEIVGSELTAVVRNISNKPLKLIVNEPFLTLVFYPLQTPSTKPYVETVLDPSLRAHDLDLKAQKIREFVELQKAILDQLKDKLSYKDVLESLSLLTATLGLVICFVVAFVSPTSPAPVVNIGAFTVDRSVMLFALAFLLTVLLVAVSMRRK